jgi:hypothetical protein
MPLFQLDDILSSTSIFLAVTTSSFSSIDSSSIETTMINMDTSLIDSSSALSTTTMLNLYTSQLSSEPTDLSSSLLLSTFYSWFTLTSTDDNTMVTTQLTDVRTHDSSTIVIDEYSTLFETTTQSHVPYTSLILSTIQTSTPTSWQSTSSSLNSNGTQVNDISSLFSTASSTSISYSSLSHSTTVPTTLTSVSSSIQPKPFRRKKISRQTSTMSITTSRVNTYRTRRRTRNRITTQQSTTKAFTYSTSSINGKLDITFRKHRSNSFACYIFYRLDSTTIATVPLTSSRNSKSTLFKQQNDLIVFQPLFEQEGTNQLLSNDILNTLMDAHTTNSSVEKSIFINLMDFPASTWDVSLQTNESVRLDIALPSSIDSNGLGVTTNLSLSNIQADRFAANIVGSSINLQVDQIETKEFSLTMNLTNNGTNDQSSDVAFGHIKSDQFHLNITKANKMNLQVQQVDSETAELYFSDKFCTNDSDVEINLNLSKNGTYS